MIMHHVSALLATETAIASGGVSTHAWWPILWAALISLVTIFDLVFLVYLVRQPTLDAALKWRITLVLLAILVAAFASLSSVMPETQKSLADVAGQRGQIAFSFAGTFAMWLVAYLILVKTLKTDLPQTRTHQQWVNEMEKSQRYRNYDDWLIRLGTCARVVERDDWAFINELLPKVFYRGPAAYDRLESPTVSTLFIYDGDKTVKIQRIYSERSDSGPVYLYDPTSPSNRDGDALSLLLFRRPADGRIDSIELGQRGRWVRRNGSIIDCLIVAEYTNDPVQEGDFVHIDVAKYIPLRNDPGGATVNLYILADRPIPDGGIQWWELKASADLTRTPLAVIFKRIESGVVSGSDEVIRSARRQLSTWLDALRMQHDTGMQICAEGDRAKTVGIVKRALSLADQYGLTNLTSGQRPIPGAYGLATTCDSVVVSLFHWDPTVQSGPPPASEPGQSSTPG